MNFELLQLLIFRADLNSRSYTLTTPLHEAAARGQTAIVDLLLLSGALVDPVDKVPVFKLSKT